MISNIPNWQSMTAAEIVAYAESHHETARPMNAQELRNFLADNRLAWFGLSGGWRGPLADSVATLAGSGDPQMAALSSGIERLLSHLASPGSVQVDTHLASHGPLVIGMIGALQLSVDQIRDLYALGGGRKFPALSIQEAQEAIDAEAIAARNQNWRTRFDAILNQIGTVEQADGVAALRMMADEMEAV